MRRCARLRPRRRRRQGRRDTRGIEILVHADHGLSGEILRLKLGLEGVIGRFNAPALKVQLAWIADRQLVLVRIGQQGFRLSAGQTDFQNTDSIVNDISFRT